MKGVITGKDVLLHPLTVVRLFGLATLLGCLWATITRKQSTFLEILYPRWSPTR